MGTRSHWHDFSSLSTESLWITCKQLRCCGQPFAKALAWHDNARPPHAKVPRSFGLLRCYSTQNGPRILAVSSTYPEMSDMCGRVGALRVVGVAGFRRL